MLTLLAVQGGSMRPVLEPGDRLLIVRRRRYRIGDLVAVPDPRDPARVLVKRISSIEDDRVEVRGDAADASTDSRVFGPVLARSLLGRAVYRYAPPARAGRL